MDAPAGERPRPEPVGFDPFVYRDLVARHARLIAASAVLGALAGGVYALTRPVTYESTAQVLIEREDPAVVTFRRVGEVSERGFSEEYYQTQLRLLRGRTVAERAVERLGLDRDEDFLDRAENARERDAAGKQAAAVAAVQRDLKIEWVRMTRLVTVTFRARRPELAAGVANAVAEGFIAEMVRLRGQATSDAAALLAAEIDEESGRVAAAEAALQQMRRTEGLGDAVMEADERRTIAEQRVRDVNMALNNAVARRLEREATYSYMKDAADPQELPDVVRNPVIQSLRIELGGLERRLALLDVKYLSQHPEVLRTTNQIQETKEKIAAETARLLHVAENEYKAVLANERSLRAASDEAKRDLHSLEARFMAFDAARRDLTASKTVLGNLMVRRKEMDASRTLHLSNARLAEPARPPVAPLRSSPGLHMALGALLGGLLALVLAVGRERLDHSVRTPDDVRNLPARLLAVIPARGAAEPVLLRASDQDLFRESYRLLCAALETPGAENTGRTLLVTSTTAGEGKTVTAANVAITLAARQDRVLLVDADLRIPRVHEMVSARAAPGLAEALSGRVDAAATVQRLEGSTLQVLTAGHTDAASPDLLEPAGLGRLLDGLRGAYSWIVIDSPPLGQVADALALAGLADEVILVVGAESTPRNAVSLTLERLAEAGARVAGVVLNRARVDRYPHQYRLHYGHGYGEQTRWKRASTAGSDAAA